MFCKKIQELILTDYIDDEISLDQKTIIQNHILSCPECLEFETNVKKTIIQSFQDIKKIKPPDYLWNHIKETITQQKKRSLAALIHEKIKELATIPHPVFAFSTAALALMIAIVAAASPYYFSRIRNQQLANIALEEQITFLTNYENGQTSDSNEEYFI